MQGAAKSPLALSAIASQSNDDIDLVEIGTPTVRPLLRSRFDEEAGALSPDTSCDPADYATPEVPIAVLPGVEPAITSSITPASAAETTPEAPSEEWQWLQVLLKCTTW